MKVPSTNGGPVVFEVDGRHVERRRGKRRNHCYVDVGVLGVAIFLSVTGLVAPAALEVTNAPLLFAGVVALYAIGIYALWADRRTWLSINSVKVTTEGFSPPFKPNQHLVREDWFIPYGMVAEIQPVEEKKGFVPAYDVTLVDGLTFQVNALDLLTYVGEKEVRSYAHILGVIHDELQKPENVGKRRQGKEIVIPRASFATN